MRTNARRRYAAAMLAAAALTLSACSATAEEPAQAGDSTVSAAPSATPTPTERPEGLQPVPFDAASLDGTDPSKARIDLAVDWVGKVATGAYGLSGQFTLDGNDPANIATLWSNYFSDDLKAKLSAAGVNGDLTGFGTWAIMAVAPPESTDPIKASPSCTMNFDSCTLVLVDNGAPATQTNVESITSSSNSVAYEADITVPVSLTEQGGAEGVLLGHLSVDITFVENPTPGDGRPPFLIDSVKNELTDAKAQPATDYPQLRFSGTTR